MTAKEIQTSIDSYKERMRYERQRAHAAIDSNEFTIAAMAVAQANAYKGAIDELEFMLESMEVEA